MSPLVEQFRTGGVALDLRLLAASGALPLKPEDLVELLVLLYDTDTAVEVREAARPTLAGLPEADLLPILSNRETPAAVLTWAVRERAEYALLEATLQNVSLPSSAIEVVVSRFDTSLLELVVINHKRLIDHAGLLEAVEANPNLEPDQRRRLREFRTEFRDKVEPPPPLPVVEAPPPEPPALAEDEAVAHYLTEDEQKQTESVSAVQRLYRMHVAEKLVLALKGTKEERALLIRDPNRLVYSAVLSSPKVEVKDVESFAGMRNVSDQVLRAISLRRDWLTIEVMRALVFNPRTPVDVGLRLIHFLGVRDHKALSVDRNVAEPIRRAAQRLLRRGPKAA